MKEIKNIKILKPEFQNKELSIKAITLVIYGFFCAVLKYIKNHPFKILSGWIVLFYIIVPAISNYAGVCSEKGRRLTDDEKIRFAIQYLIDAASRLEKNKFYSEKTVAETLLKFPKGENEDLFKAVPRNVDDFLHKYPNCCSVSKKEPGGEYHIWKPNFFDRITGYNHGDIIEIKYAQYRLNKNGKKELKPAVAYYSQQNCGAMFFK